MKMSVISGTLLSLAVGAYFFCFGEKIDETVLKGWKECPIVATEIKVGEVNDISIELNESSILKMSGVILDKVEEGGFATSVFELDGQGFYITNYGTIPNECKIYTNVYYDLYKTLFTITEDDLAQVDKPFFLMRLQLLPVGSHQNLNYFESSTKKGFISGSPKKGLENTLLTLFDAKGDYCITVTAKENVSMSDWTKLAERMILKPVQP